MPAPMVVPAIKAMLPRRLPEEDVVDWGGGAACEEVRVKRSGGNIPKYHAMLGRSCLPLVASNRLFRFLLLQPLC